MDDAEYYRRRTLESQRLAARAVGPVRAIHLDLAARYAECERHATAPHAIPLPRG